MGARIIGLFKELGLASGASYLADRVLRSLGPACGARLFEIVEQPVAATGALLPAAHARHVRFVELDRDSPEVRAMPRPADVIQARFDAGTVALAVYLRDKYVGYVWLAFDHYDDDEVRCRYTLRDAARTAFDFDVYVFPQYRLGRAFAAVWHAANQYLGARHIERTCSRIAGINLASQRAHAQLGARRLYRALFVFAGRLQLVVSPALPAPWFHVGRSRVPTLPL
jgi:hypothetical protein